MMENASWRDDRRKQNVQRSKENDKKADKDYDEHFNPDFIRKQLSKAAESGSVAKRLNANRHHVQKGAHIMDSNFARK
ncbi:Uncharacterized protein FKW44_021402 [Caligus rogercresseyi]|uniref:Uncharacterized protein n=1 Tax=Caligus rogercresseyi TaxID=217165 RepID=A0A7T8GRT0_CALRO|nr:Uncharacterized protein FKW44_021402 [Caligus rogercresseyi]